MTPPPTGSDALFRERMTAIAEPLHAIADAIEASPERHSRLPTAVSRAMSELVEEPNYASAAHGETQSPTRIRSGI